MTLRRDRDRADSDRHRAELKTENGRQTGLYDYLPGVDVGRELNTKKRKRQRLTQTQT